MNVKLSSWKMTRFQYESQGTCVFFINMNLGFKDSLTDLTKVPAILYKA